MQLQLSGLASGFDWQSVVDQLTELERAPQQRMRADQSTISQKQSVLNSLTSELESLKTKSEALSTGDLFDQRSVSNSDETVATATAAAGALQGSYQVTINQMATASSQQGSADIGGNLNATSDVSSLVLSNATFSTPVTEGVFTVNNTQITVSTSDNLQTVLGAIATAIGGSATYNSSTDQIVLSGSSEIILGSVNDTSNFLQVAQLYNNESSSVSSASKLGRINTATVLDQSNWSTSLTDGGSGAGSFKINGVSIAFNDSADTLEDVMDRINTSTAGVIASYDPTNDRMQLTNKSTGDLGVSLQDVTGNFLTASGLLTGSLSHGNNLEFTINGGGTITSFNNTADASVTGIAGLQITAVKTGSNTITVETDRTAINESISGLVSQFNKVQSFLATYTGTTIGSDESVSSGILARDSDIRGMASELRALMTGSVASLGADLNELDDLGAKTSGYSNEITLSSTSLDEAILNSLDSVKTLFQDSTDGIAVKLLDYVETALDDEGTIADKLSNLSTQSSDIDDQIARQERLVQMRRQSMIDSFVAMETAQQQINQQMQFLESKFSG
jgi:flagellar hook-associated protein 2